jgi:hypothetical protein
MREVYVRRDRQEDEALAAVALTPADLDDGQRRLLEAIAAHEETFAGDLGASLSARRLPSTPELLRRFLAGERSAKASVLDRPLGRPPKAKTVGDTIVAAAMASGKARAAHVAAIAAALAPHDAVDALFSAIVDIGGEDIHLVALDLAWACGPKAEGPLREALARFARDGAPKRVTADTTIEFPLCFVAAAVGLAAAAITKKKPAGPELDGYLQRAYGYLPRVRDALAALPIERRERWVLAPERDDREQPSEDFLGAWPYWTTTPTKDVTARVLAHVAKWKPKDPWGGKRETFAVPHLAAYIDALRAAGQDASACEAALAQLGKRRSVPSARGRLRPRRTP